MRDDRDDSGRNICSLQRSIDAGGPDLCKKLSRHNARKGWIEPEEGLETPQKVSFGSAAICLAP
jgi:hypothetical protein